VFISARYIRNAYLSIGVYLVYLYPVNNKEKVAPIGMKFVKGIFKVGLGCIDIKDRKE